ncbi:translocase [Donghicola sp. XS_ASV15]|uniref:translocase n=1 Tax=Donghicola sp. XS_ASV15 TaxID=3241295 RepID=UPI003513C379
MTGSTSRYMYAVALGAIALGIGGAMQYGSIILVSSAPSGAAPILPIDPEYVQLAAIPLEVLHDVREVSSQPDPVLSMANAISAPENKCEITMTANPAAAAMVSVDVKAPCHANTAVTIHHNGLMFTETTDDNGALSLDVPALSENALFMADFGGADVAVAATDVSSFIFYDRAVVQWQGQSGLELHAREFSEDYSGPGHVWRDAARNTSIAAQGKGGMLIELGNSNLPQARLAEVYTFPSLTSDNSGDVLLSVEAEVTTGNCAQDVNAQILQTNGSGRVRVQDVLISVPECDAVGELLVLQNVLDDLKIAAR